MRKAPPGDHCSAKGLSPQGDGPTVVDLFCGAGGISEGFRQAGFRILAGVDADPDAIATYALNFPEALAINADIRSTDALTLIASIAANVDVLVGGPPCQAFSQVRNHARLIDDPRNGLYRQFVSILAKCAPRAFLMENVTGIDQLNAREQILNDLTLGGEYSVRARVLDAADFGVPQSRKRLIFIGVRTDLNLTPPTLVGTGASRCLTLKREVGPDGTRYVLSGQESALSQRSLIDALRDPADASVVSVSDAIADLRLLRSGRREDDLAVAALPPASSAYQLMMRDPTGSVVTNVQVPRSQADTAIRLGEIPPGGNHRDLPPEFLDRYLTGQRWGQSNGTGKLSRRHFYAYRKLHPDIWAWTLNTKADAAYHYAEPRALSVREFARLQSFPDRFRFVVDERRGSLRGRIDGGSSHSKYRQVGNAVPVLLAFAAGVAMKSMLISHRFSGERLSA